MGKIMSKVNKNSQQDKLIKFYLNLPKDIIDECELEDFSRPIRRQLKNLKKEESKIKAILKEEGSHQIFINFLYEKFVDKEICLNDINTIIESLNEENFYLYLIYMLKNFYDTDELNKFIKSTKFDELLQKVKVNDIILEKTMINTQNLEGKISSQDKYIVNIKYESGFNNIYPLFKLSSNGLEDVEKDEYPNYGNINVNPYEVFTDKGYDIKSRFWVCCFDINDLEITSNKTKYKINGDFLVENNKVYELNKEFIYEIVDLNQDYENLEEDLKNNNIEIEKPELDQICLSDENFIYGPFKYIKDEKTDKFYIDKSNSDYMVKRFNKNKNKNKFSIKELYNPKDYNDFSINIIYLYDYSNIEFEKIDIISDEELINRLKNLSSLNDDLNLKNELEKIIYVLVNSKNDLLSQERINRLINDIKNLKENQEFLINGFVELIEQLLLNSSVSNAIQNKILNVPNILRNLQNVSLVEKEVEAKKIELERLDLQLKELKNNISKEEKNNIEKLIEDEKNEIKSLKSEKSILSDEINNLKARYNLSENIEELTKKVDELTIKAKQTEDEYSVLLRRKSGIESEIINKIEQATEVKKYSDIAFDGLIANKMLDSASKWARKKEKDEFEELILSKKNIDENLIKKLNDNELIDYLCNEIQKVRNYSRNEIINIMICITQGFLTVFAGEPGVGKTSICNIIANTLGLNIKGKNINRFLEVSVEKGWTSKRDFIGYYNPLTRNFNKNNSSLFKAFSVLNKEFDDKINDFPYLILLDEANLSSMEHYWADFMNVCDLEKVDRKINLGEEYIFNIPKTLRFLATINYDHTTEVLSPRLLDRAWIILLDNKLDFNSLLLKDNIAEIENIILYSSLRKCFFNNESTDEDLSKINVIIDELSYFCEIFKENNIEISPRINLMMQKYLITGVKLFEDTETTAKEFVALDYAISQKLLPKINGYGQEYKENFLDLINEKFDKNNMMKCKSIIDRIIKKGKNNMNYYQFFS